MLTKIHFAATELEEDISKIRLRIFIRYDSPNSCVNAEFSKDLFQPKMEKWFYMVVGKGEVLEREKIAQNFQRKWESVDIASFYLVQILYFQIIFTWKPNS